MSETTPKDHLIILHEFLAGNKILATSSSTRARINLLESVSKLLVRKRKVTSELYRIISTMAELLSTWSIR